MSEVNTFGRIKPPRQRFFDGVAAVQFCQIAPNCDPRFRVQERPR
jgi:hypothetical protein